MTDDETPRTATAPAPPSGDRRPLWDQVAAPQRAELLIRALVQRNGENPVVISDAELEDVAEGGMRVTRNVDEVVIEVGL